MSELITPSITLSIFTLMIGVIFCTFAYTRHVNKRLHQTILLLNDLYQVSKEQSASITMLNAEIVDMTHSEKDNEQILFASKVETRLTELAEQLVIVENQTQLLKQEDPVLKMYNRATQLVQKGANIEDIVEACQLPRAEVEVLIGLQASNKGQKHRAIFDNLDFKSQYKA